MLKRVLIFGVVLVILAGALLIDLSILDIITVQHLKETLGKAVSVIAVSVVAVLLILAVAKVAGKREP